MAREIRMLSAVAINRMAAKDHGSHCDGGALYLQVSSSGTQSWVFRYKINGRTRDMCNAHPRPAGFFWRRLCNGSKALCTAGIAAPG